MSRSLFRWFAVVACLLLVSVTQAQRVATGIVFHDINRRGKTCVLVDVFFGSERLRVETTVGMPARFTKRTGLFGEPAGCESRIT